MEYSTKSLIEMECYVKYNLYYGQPKLKIKQVLIEQGWDKKEINKAFEKAEKIKEYTPQPQKKPIEEKPDDIDIPLPPSPNT